MYFPYFMTYMLVGMGITLPVLLWALNSGQFKDQQRARFLPLAGEDHDPPPVARPFRRFEIFTLMALALAGLGASAAVLVFALMSAGQRGG